MVSFNWAQYAIAALSPDIEVAFDGRFRTCYPQEVVDMHFDFLLGANGGKRSRSPHSGPIDGARVLDYGSPDLVLFDRRYEHSMWVMRQACKRKNPEWVWLYCDRIAEIWGRVDRYDEPTHPDYIPSTARVLDKRPRQGYVQWPALPIKNRPTKRLAEQTPESQSEPLEVDL